MSEKEICECGHVRKNHNSVVGLVDGGLRIYLSCRYCYCERFEVTEEDVKQTK